MDGKQFLEVFPTLQLKNDLKDAFQDVCVEHIFTTKRRDFLRIYIRLRSSFLTGQISR